MVSRGYPFRTIGENDAIGSNAHVNTPKLDTPSEGNLYSNTNNRIFKGWEGE